MRYNWIFVSLCIFFHGIVGDSELDYVTDSIAVSLGQGLDSSTLVDVTTEVTIETSTDVTTYATTESSSDSSTLVDVTTEVTIESSTDVTTYATIESSSDVTTDVTIESSTDVTTDTTIESSTDESVATKSETDLTTTATDMIPTEEYIEETTVSKVEFISDNSVEEGTTVPSNVKTERLSDQIRAVINHYRDFGTVTVPGADVPDPFEVPDLKTSIGRNPITFTNQKLYGLSNFTIDHVNTDLDKNQVYVSVYMKRLIILGNYSVKAWFKKASGRFNITLLDVEASGAVELRRDENGTLFANDTQMDMTFMDAVVDFKNLGLMGTILQSVLVTAAPIAFDGIKPFILIELNKRIREDVNTKIKLVAEKMAVSKSAQPLEIAIMEGRKYVKEQGYDPYYVKNYVIRHSILKVNISQFVLYGLSDFYRVGDVSLSMDNGTVQMGIHLAVVNLTGRCKWSVSLGKGFERSGWTNFTVGHFQVRAFVNQSLDVKQTPRLEDLDLNVGKVRVYMQGAGGLDLFIETMVQTLPDLIRHIIVDAIEEPVKYKVQSMLNDVNVEEILEKGLPELDNMGI